MFDKTPTLSLIEAIMRMKMKPLAKITTAAFLLGGVLCGSATAGNVTALWSINCAACHGKDGKGDTMMGHRLQIKDLTDAKVQAALTDDQATKDIKDGITENGRALMKGFGSKFSDEQIKDLVAHVRSFKSK